MECPLDAQLGPLDEVSFRGSSDDAAGGLLLRSRFEDSRWERTSGSRIQVFKKNASFLACFLRDAEGLAPTVQTHRVDRFMRAGAGSPWQVVRGRSA